MQASVWIKGDLNNEVKLTLARGGCEWSEGGALPILLRIFLYFIYFDFSPSVDQTNL